MDPTTTAILGLFFGFWSHEVFHSYDRQGYRASLWIGSVFGVIGTALLLSALVRAIGWFA